MRRDGCAEERDLYAKLLGFMPAGDIEELMVDALEVARLKLGAKQAFLGIYGQTYSRGDRPTWFAAIGFRDAEKQEIQDQLSSSLLEWTEVERRMSTTMLERTFVDGDQQVISALGRGDLAAQPSVQLNELRQVETRLVGSDHLGVLYIQGRDRGIFGERDRAYLDNLARLLGRHVDQKVQDEREGQVQTAVDRWRSAGRFADVAGTSDQLANVLGFVNRLAQTDEPVLFEGAPGTGKSMFAQHLHALSKRGHARIVPVGRESGSYAQIFGGPRGAHSYVDLADGGTLLIEGLEQFDRDVLDGLARLLETGEVVAEGAVERREVDVRVIITSQQPLERLLDRGQLSRSCYDRLLAGRIVVPSLADRVEDIEPIAQHFGQRCAAKLEMPWTGYTAGAMDAARRANWPGNVLQLLSTVEAALLRKRDDEPVDIEDLFPPRATAAADNHVFTAGGPIPVWSEACDAYERSYLKAVLRRAGGSRPKAAEIAGMGRATIYKRINALWGRGVDPLDT